ncbi:MAG TPA: hypothetical protein VK172_14740 [Lentimicrobium sp.]|nr:hypothetical protein [Bacteroidales bacterium]HLO92419.1 hypothetical protein [Lentimicrobium sp.]
MNAWQGLALLFVGFAAGLFLGAKYGTKPVNEYHFDKVKAKGKDNEITSIITPREAEEKKKRFRLFKRKNRNNEQAQ